LKGASVKRTSKPITDALVKIMLNPYPGDKLGRTGAELLGLAMFQEAVAKGSVAAASLVADRVEGKIVDHIEVTEPRTAEQTRERILRLVERLRESDSVH
jgi:hypothetical protein